MVSGLTCTIRGILRRLHSTYRWLPYELYRADRAGEERIEPKKLDNGHDCRSSGGSGHRLQRRQSGANRVLCELRDAVGAELFHDAAAVGFDGLRADAELVGDLLGRAAVGDA